MEAEKHRIGICTGDVLVLAAVLLIAAALFVLPFVWDGGSAASFEIVTPDGCTRYPLSENRDFDVISSGYSLHISVRDGTVFVARTDCPSGICAASGRVSSTHQSIVCAPAHLLIRIVGEEGAYGENADVVLP